MKILIQGVDKKAIKKILFQLTKDLIVYAIKQSIMDEFLKQELDVKFEKDIEAWFVYLDQKKFGYQLNKKILIEVKRYMASKKTVDEILAELFKKPKWIIEIEEGLMEKYPELRLAYCDI